MPVTSDGLPSGELSLLPLGAHFLKGLTANFQHRRRACKLLPALDRHIDYFEFHHVNWASVALALFFFVTVGVRRNL